MSLSEDQIQEYRTRGVLRVRGALTPEDLQPVIEELEEIIDRRARRLHADGEIEERGDAPIRVRLIGAGPDQSAETRFPVNLSP